MFGRILFLGVVGVFTAATLLSGAVAPRPADAAASISNLTFSTEMTGDFQPAGQSGIEFSGDNNGVYVTFTYSDLPPGSGLTRIVRLNNGDFNWDSDPYPRLQCCNAGGSGRYGFRVVKLSGHEGDIPGGAYSVRIYLNGTEIQQGGFGVKGEGGADNGNSGIEGGNGNDNS